MELKAFSARKHETVWFRMAVSLAFVLPMLGVIYLSSVEPAAAAAVSDIRMTKHNLSKFQKDATANPNTTKSTTEDQVCVFCHTPHAATAGLNPLWNRQTSGSTYTKYGSSATYGAESLDSSPASPAGSSLLCLSCHDGQVALGNVNVLNGQTNAQISVNGSTTTKMPDGSGTSTGFTRNLGTDLSNDHPISITYDQDLVDKDGELQPLTESTPVQRDTLSDPDGLLIGIRTSGYKPKLPLQNTGASGAGQVQCGTCHDPHLYDSSDANRKFLRLRRLQSDNNPTASFSEADDIICLACHTKLGTSWAYSAHADKGVAEETYSDTTAASLRNFPTTTKVSNAACLNCHDTHTKQGARRLLREGADGSGNSTMEETCYQCHSSTKIISGTSTDTSSSTTVTNLIPDIKTEFGRTRRMPITGTETHKIGDTTFEGGGVDCTGATNKCGADLVETRANLANRHVECTDCHNPHRVRRNSLFYGTPGDANSNKRTHDVGGANGNIASGVLRGTWGVEPNYGTLTAASVWPATPTFGVKRGDPTSSDTGRGNDYLTREYQLCFKCHSNYAVTGTFPSLGGTGLTPSPTNSMTNYTNIAAEFGVKAVDGTVISALTGTDQCEYGGDTNCTPYGATWDTQAKAISSGDPGYPGSSNKINHRSWHPVHYPTGRTPTERGNSTVTDGGGNFRAPFQANLGLQTMYCSDCHGNSGGATTNATTGTAGLNSWIQGTGPNLRRTQGPHGSESNFLLKGVWNPTSNNPGSPGICGNCHVGSTNSSGWRGNDGEMGHSSEKHGGKACGRCHIAVPHGWKNKAFLVNNNCIGTEGGAASACVEADTLTGYSGGSGDQNNNDGVFTVGPYYVGAALRVNTWRISRGWRETSCGPPSGTVGKDWMTDTC